MIQVVQVDKAMGALGHAIELAITPVFLLSGVAAFLNVLNARLARVIDRSRVLEARADQPLDEDHAEKVVLMKRRRSIDHSITFSVVCAIFISTVVLLFFVSLLTHVQLTKVVAVLFVAAMIALILSLFYFLHEIHLATRFFRRANLP